MSSKPFRKRDVIDRIVLVINTLMLVGLLITYLSGTIGPSAFWPLAFVAMGYPIMLVITLAFTFYWALRRRWYFILNLFFLVIKWEYVTATINFTFPNSDHAEGIKVMSYNVRMFDRYNWSNDRTTKQRAQEFIFGQQPDILCIQEFYLPKGDRFRSIDTLSNSNSIKHLHTVNYKANANAKHRQGLATLTRFPVIEKGEVDLDDSHSGLAIYTTMLVGDDTVRVYNLHLQSIHLGKHGYEVIDELMKKQDLEDVNGGKMVLRQMKKGFIKRAEQAEIIAKHISECEHKVIVCGDFNDVPTSFAYQTISNGLEDSFSQAGSGLGSTYVRVPFFRIDNILFSEGFEAVEHTVHPYELSDHFAVTATLERTK